MLTLLMWMQATWLSKLHEAQEKYQETVRSRYREGGESSAEAAAAASAGASSHGLVGGPLSESVVPAHGDCLAGAPDFGTAVVAAGRGWLGAAGTTSSLIVPSFAVSDYGELVCIKTTFFSDKFPASSCNIIRILLLLFLFFLLKISAPDKKPRREKDIRLQQSEVEFTGLENTLMSVACSRHKCLLNTY